MADAIKARIEEIQDLAAREVAREHERRLSALEAGQQIDVKTPLSSRTEIDRSIQEAVKQADEPVPF